VKHAFSFRRFGISIFAYIGSLVAEATARGVIGGLWAERRRRRAIEALRDHYIIGRFGGRVAQVFAPRETLAR